VLLLQRQHVRTVISGVTVIGSRNTPDSNRFDLGHLGGLRLGSRFLWTIPIPPSCAIAIARRASVTVSIAADTSGMFSSSFRVRRVFRETSLGRTREWAGRSRTSSKVSAFWIIRMDILSHKTRLYASKRLTGREKIDSLNVSSATARRALMLWRGERCELQR
jgi:hypothetical protein